MSIPKDPVMLMSFLNMKLRDEFSSLMELCKSLSLDESDIIKKMSDVGFEYNKDLNQFRQGWGVKSRL